MATAQSDEEMDKRLLAAAIGGYPLILLDNICGALGTPALAMALTSAEYKGRLLGLNKLIIVPMQMVCIATGNNLTFGHDVGRRVVPIDIDAREEHPEDRDSFKYPKLRETIRRMRSGLVVDALTVLRAYHLAGRPVHGGPRVGSFEAWDDVIRGACIWVGLGDPAAGRTRVREEADLDLDMLRAFVSSWFDAFHDAPMTLKEVADKWDRHPELAAALKMIDAKSDGKGFNARVIAGYLRKRKGRVVAGLRFEEAGREHGAVRWRTARVERPVRQCGESGEFGESSCSSAPTDPS